MVTRMEYRGRGKGAGGERVLHPSPRGDHAGEPCSGELRAEGCLGTLGEVFWERREWCVRSGEGRVGFYRRGTVTSGRVGGV
jgi:hypothetical protein